MSLCELIDRFESGEFPESDLKHPLAINVLEELEWCREDTDDGRMQTALFSDVRKLSDDIIERYFTLTSGGRTEKLELASVYQSEKCFSELGGVVSATQKMLKCNLGEDNYNLLFHISRYSKFIPVLENFVGWAERNKTNPSFNNNVISLPYYLNTHNVNGNEVKKQSGDSLHKLSQYDFRVGKQFKKRSADGVLESMVYGVGDKSLISDVRDLIFDLDNRISMRTQVLKNFREWAKKNKLDPLFNNNADSLFYYLNNFSIDGNSVKSMSGDSLHKLSQYDFRVGKQFKKRSADGVLESMVYGVGDKSLISDVRDLIFDLDNRISMRTQVLKNYREWAKEVKLAPQFDNRIDSLAYYLKSHNIKGKPVENYESKDSLSKLCRYNFRTGKKEEKLGAKGISESLIYCIDNESLISDVRGLIFDLDNRISMREEVLKNFVVWAKKNKLDPLFNNNADSLFYYLMTHDSEYRSVKYHSSDSSRKLCMFDFRVGKMNNNLDREEVLESMVYDIGNESLISDVRGLVYDLDKRISMRTQILENFVGWIEINSDFKADTQPLIYYLKSTNLNGESIETYGSGDSMNKLTIYDFRVGKGDVSLGADGVLESMVYDIKDKNLVKQVRHYALEWKGDK